MLITTVLGAMLAVGSVSPSLAGHHGGGGFGGHGFGHHDGGGHGYGGGFGGIPYLGHGHGGGYDGGFHYGHHGGHYHGGYGGYGLLLSPYLDDDDAYDYNDSVGYCEDIHPSYNPYTGTYIGRDGRAHYCP